MEDNKDFIPQPEDNKPEGNNTPNFDPEEVKNEDIPVNDTPKEANEAQAENNIPPYFPPHPPVEPPMSRFGQDAGPSMPPPPRPPQHSGEYRYVPPYAGIGANQPPKEPPKAPPAPPTRPAEPKKEKVKTVRTFSTAALILILVGSIIISFASGMLGALLVSGGLNAPSEQTEPDSDGSDRGELIIDNADEDSEGENTSDMLSGSYDITDVCAVVSASVVEITTEFNVTYYGHFQYVQEGAGSGVIISNDGYILTNAHVITDADSGKLADTINIRLNSGKEYDAEIIGSDNDSDIALLKVSAKGLTAATVGDSDKLEVGQQIIAVGNPLGELGGTVTSGIISATNREITVENNKMTLIQTDAAINPGNSGGGLFNTNGELIGIVNAKTTDVTVEGLGFAIPVNEAIHVAKELESHGYVTGKTYIGISLTDVTDAYTAYYYFRSESTGVYVTNVQEGYNDGVLKYGDRITAIEDEEVTSSADVKEAIGNHKVGDKLTFTISREGKLKNVEVTLYEYVPENDVSFED